MMQLTSRTKIDPVFSPPILYWYQAPVLLLSCFICALTLKTFLKCLSPFPFQHWLQKSHEDLPALVTKSHEDSGIFNTVRGKGHEGPVLTWP